MRVERYLNYNAPTGYWFIPFEPDGIQVNNYTNRSCYVNLGRNDIPSMKKYDVLVPAGASQTIPVSYNQAFAAALDMTVVDSGVTRKMPLQCELIFATKEDLATPASIISSRTGNIPADVYSGANYAPGAHPVMLFTCHAQIVSTLHYMTLGLSPTTADDKATALLMMIRLPVGIMPVLLFISSLKARNQFVTQSVEIQLREGDKIELFIQNNEAVANVGCEVSLIITNESAP